jgi:hypothetical protein
LAETLVDGDTLLGPEATPRGVVGFRWAVLVAILLLVLAWWWGVVVGRCGWCGAGGWLRITQWMRASLWSSC